MRQLAPGQVTLQVLRAAHLLKPPSSEQVDQDNDDYPQDYHDHLCEYEKSNDGCHDAQYYHVIVNPVSEGWLDQKLKFPIHWCTRTQCNLTVRANK